MTPRRHRPGRQSRPHRRSVPWRPGEAARPAAHPARSRGGEGDGWGVAGPGLDDNLDPIGDQCRGALGSQRDPRLTRRGLAWDSDLHEVFLWAYTAEPPQRSARGGSGAKCSRGRALSWVCAATAEPRPDGRSRLPAMEDQQSAAVIHTTGLTKHYGKVQALVDLSLDVRPGEIFGFLGPNGSGKSPMIRTLLGFLHPTSGSARVLGLDIADDSVEIRRRTGYLPGGIALYDSLSGAAALDYLNDLQGTPAVRREELCERLQMPPSVLRRKVRDYSRGMRQKIGVIQALQHDPELAILDEPTEGLDPLMQQAFYSLMDDLRDQGRTTFLSSHVLPEVERICDRVAIIRSGHLMALQNVDDLLARRKRKVSLRWRGVAPELSDRK